LEYNIGDQFATVFAVNAYANYVDK